VDIASARRANGKRALSDSLRNLKHPAFLATVFVNRHSNVVTFCGENSLQTARTTGDPKKLLEN
jgi:hypothetical protein